MLELWVEVIAGTTMCVGCEAVRADGGPRGDAASAAMLDQLRTATLGEYMIQRELGRGRLTFSYLAHEVELGRDVVVKVLRPEHARHRALFDRFWRAASHAASPSAHPNVVRVFRAPERKGIRFLVMQHVDGCTLEQLLRAAEERDTAPSIGVVRYLLTQTVAALRFAHEHDVVHGDVEPGNVLIDRQGAVVVSDFGIAEVANRFAVGAMPWCASPEQWRGATPTAASDQYAVGAIAYRLLGGAPPFGGSATELRRAHVNEAPPSLRRARPDCPEKLAALVDRMLATDPDARWPSLAVVHDTLTRLSLPAESESPADALGALVIAAAASATTPAAPAAEQVTPDGAPLGPWKGVGEYDWRPTSSAAPLGTGPLGTGPLGAGPLGATPSGAPTLAAGLPPSHPAFEAATVEQVRVIASRVPRRGGRWRIVAASLAAVAGVVAVQLARARSAREAVAEHQAAEAVVAAVGTTAPQPRAPAVAVPQPVVRPTAPPPSAVTRVASAAVAPTPTPTPRPTPTTPAAIVGSAPHPAPPHSTPLSSTPPSSPPPHPTPSRSPAPSAAAASVARAHGERAGTVASRAAPSRPTAKARPANATRPLRPTVPTEKRATAKSKVAKAKPKATPKAKSKVASTRASKRAAKRAVKPAAKPAATRAPKSASGAVPTVASSDVTLTARSAVDGFVDALTSRRPDAVARRLAAGDGGGRAFARWLRDARALEVSPVIIEPPVRVSPDSAVGAVRVWLHWRDPARGPARRDAEARFRIPLTRVGGVWRAGAMEAAGPLPGR